MSEKPDPSNINGLSVEAEIEVKVTISPEALRALSSFDQEHHPYAIVSEPVPRSGSSFHDISHLINQLIMNSSTGKTASTTGVVPNAGDAPNADDAGKEPNADDAGKEPNADGAGKVPNPGGAPNADKEPNADGADKVPTTFDIPRFFEEMAKAFLEGMKGSGGN